MASTLISSADVGRIEQQLYTAMSAGDQATLKKMLSDKLRYYHSNARLQSKAEVLEDFKAPQNKKFTSENTVIDCYPGVAIVSTLLTITADSGTPTAKTSKLQVAYVFVEEAQGWALLLRSSARPA